MNNKRKKRQKAIQAILIVMSFIILIVVLLLPAPSSLPIMAKAVLAILAFAVIMWVTEAVSYPVSATLIIGLMILLLGFSPVQNLGRSWVTRKVAVLF